MTRSLSPSLSIPLFDRTPIIPPSRSPCPTAAARSGGQGRPSGRRGRASPLTAASTVAGMLRVGTAVVTVTLVTLIIGAFSAEGRAGEALMQSSTSASPDAADPLAGILAEASRRFDLPQSWLRAIIGAESSGDPRAVSPKGAMGLMQVMPDTFAEMRARHGLGADPFDPATNILAGAAYLREMFDRFGAAGFLAAYHAGPGRTAEYLATGRPLPDETVAYVARLAPLLAEGPFDSRPTVSPSLFVVRLDGTSLTFRPQGDGLFVSLRPVGARR